MSSAGPASVELIGVSRTYAGAVPVEALKTTDLTLTRGSYTAIVGPSGSGKSTLMNIIGLLDDPTTGEVRIQGISTSSLSRRHRTRCRGANVGFVFQAFHLIEERSVRANVELGLVYQGVPRRERRRRGEQILREVGLSHRIGAAARTLSGGERQRVAIARALAADVKILLCDEPTGNLDQATGRSVMALLAEASASVGANGLRTLVSVAGTFVGVAVFVVTTGIGSSLSVQVNSEFDERLATEMTLRRAVGTGETGPWVTPQILNNVRSIPGVTAVGMMNNKISLASRRRTSTTALEIGVVGVNPDALRIIAPVVVVGSAFNQFDQDHAVPMVMLSVALSKRLGVHTAGNVILIADTEFTVQGIYSDVTRRGDIAGHALIPTSTFDLIVTEPITEVLVQIRVGSGPFVAPRAQLAIAPEQPLSIIPSSPLDPRNFQRSIEGTVKQLTLTMSLVALAMGTLAIANSTTASVYARTPEIGLRSAIGAPTGIIFAQLMLETMTLGVIAGVAGVIAGVAAVYVVGIWQHWDPVVDIRSLAQAMGLAVASGLSAGFGPAIRAMHIQPVDALRR